MELLLSVLSRAPCTETFKAFVDHFGEERSYELSSVAEEGSWLSGLRKHLADLATTELKEHLKNSLDLDVRRVVELIRRGGNPNICDKYGMNLLLAYISASQHVLVNEDFVELLNATSTCSYEGYTPLHFAIAYENPTFVKAVLQSGKYDWLLDEILGYALSNEETNEVLRKFSCGWDTFKVLLDAGASLDAEYEGMNLTDLLNIASDCFGTMEDIDKMRDVVEKHRKNRT